MRRTVLLVIPAIIIGAIAFAGWPSAPLSPNAVADRLLIQKHAHRLTLYRSGVPLRTYPVSLGGHPKGKKEREGDKRTPEGIYRIDRHLSQSSFHRALHVSYPNSEDVAHARALGVRAGGDIMIHGLPNGLGWLGRLQRLRDWTAGCIAVTDREIEEIARAVPDGTVVEITP
jgi:murein L,D-transpeptidase YafK